MSRIGERKLNIPEGVTVTVSGNTVTTTGAKGTLSLEVSPLVEVVVEESVVRTQQRKVSKEANMMQGTTNSLISGMLTGVSAGFEKGLEAVGVGYRFNVQGNKIVVNAGYSNPVEVIVPEGLTVELVSNTEITIKGIDKQQVSEFAANIRKYERGKKKVQGKVTKISKRRSYPEVWS